MSLKSFFALISCLVVYCSPCLAEAEWMDDLPRAFVRAKAEDKALLLYALRLQP